MAIQSVNIKIGSMRKEQSFSIYPNGTSKTHILVQSNNRIGQLNKETGVFELTPAIKGHPGFHALMWAKVEQIPQALKEEIKRKYSSMSNGVNGQIRIL